MSLYFILQFVPEVLFHLMLALGLLGLLVATIITSIPVINKYKLPIKIVALLLTVAGFYMEGAIGYKDSVAKQVAELRAKLAQAEVKSQKVNVQIVEKLVKDTEVVRLKGKTVTEYVDREIVKYDHVCPIPTEVIKAHNMAVTLDVNTNATNGENTGTTPPEAKVEDKK